MQLNSAMAAAKVNFSDYRSILMREGFPVVGAVDFTEALPTYQVHAERYRQWVGRGSHGEMTYLARGLDRRLNPKLVFPELESVITVLMPYNAQPVGNESLRYARYLNGPDYHSEIQEKLSRAMQEAQKLNPELKYKICVDTSAVLERTWAALCGLGWIGKNTLLIHPQLGSYLFIGVVFLNQKMGMKPTLLKDYCGNCILCLNACPTNALPEPHFLESRECISYLTLEKRGQWEKKIDLKGYVAGCDLCQEVCPFNVKVTRASENESATVHTSLELNLDKLLSETEEQYRARTADSALSRIKFNDFKRNLEARTKN